MKTLWLTLPLLIIALAAAVLWKGERTSEAPATRMSCVDLNQGCVARLAGREVTVGLSGTVKPLVPFEIWVRARGAEKVQSSFTMQGMDMGFNLYTLHAAADGVFRARVILPVCVSGRRDWVMTLDVDGAVLKVPFRSDF